MTQASRAFAKGSSPHTRGAPKKAFDKHMARLDHPRIRGEHIAVEEIVAALRGSSPHTRGAHRSTQRRAPTRRIIPAYAGSTTVAPQCARPQADHPRIRGEHDRAQLRTLGERGSSPHTRGAPEVWRTRPASPGIIPAYAGSTRSLCGAVVWGADHPRIRGEHLIRGLLLSGNRGSSPHTRGAHAVGRQRRAAPGIIPAYAGSTPQVSSKRTTTGDHPRIRGEHDAAAVAIEAPPGSSPHTRGAPECPEL